VLISQRGSTAHIYFYQRKCSHNKSYLIQHYCSKQPPTCADYRKLGNTCCRKAHFCTGRNSFPTFAMLNDIFPSPSSYRRTTYSWWLEFWFKLSTLSDNTSFHYFTIMKWNEICGLQLPGEPNRSTRLLHLTDR